MADVGEVRYKAVVDNSGIDTEIKKTEKGLGGLDDPIKKTSSKFSGLGKVGVTALKGIGTAFVGLASAAGAGVAAVAKMGIEYNAQMQSYQTAFTTMLGSAEKAQKLTDDLKEMAAATPLAMTDLADASQILLAFGSSAEELPDQLKRLGDVAQGDAQALGTMATAFGRIQSNGYASLEEINMMIDQGFNPLNIIAEQTGETMAEVRDRVSAGEVSFEELSNVEYQRRNETNELYIPPGPRLGDTVMEVKNLKKAYGDQVLIDDLSFILPKGAIVGIIGPNGAGKSTLFRMITGLEKPDSGSIKLGDTVVTAYVEQFRDEMKDENTVYDEISQGQDILKVGNYEIPSRAYIGRFNFKGSDQQKRVGDLSGGERGRLQLAKLLQVGGNLLLLDEPTNDLDVETLRALENALLEFPGSAMVISHDRWFLDRIATHILDYGDEGKVRFFEGNYTEYEAWKKKELGDEAIPHRMRFKKVTD